MESVPTQLRSSGVSETTPVPPPSPLRFQIVQRECSGRRHATSRGRWASRTRIVPFLFSIVVWSHLGVTCYLSLGHNAMSPSVVCSTPPLRNHFCISKDLPLRDTLRIEQMRLSFKSQSSTTSIALSDRNCHVDERFMSVRALVQNSVRCSELTSDRDDIISDINDPKGFLYNNLGVKKMQERRSPPLN